MGYVDWSVAIIQPFLQGLVAFVVNLLLAIIVFVIGYLISVGIGKLVTEILKSIKFNKLFEKEGWKTALQRARIDVDPSGFIGAIFKWVFVMVSLLVAVDILKLVQFADFLTDVLNYLPSVIGAALIFVAAVIISDIVEKLVRVAVERMKIGYGYLAASIVKWSIWIFTIFLVLDQLLPNSMLVQILYSSIIYGIVGALALGLGLAIGHGGKDVAAEILQDMKKKMMQK
ncbi:MAG: hypothetical protein HY005_02585 [Candidatus Staskawiczbacteria bacterium]|nr:hypothetical protein [Candidatus Staskawiczbacteria bacterium]MBI3337485.1 hypothetical protein [Candidatus Staskawiczbacteria bacterium]